MAKLFIANCTKQNHRIMYRLDYDNNGERASDSRYRMPKHQDVGAGKQVQLGSDFHPTQIDDIEKQLRPYGLIGVVDLKNLDSMNSVPWVYNIDTPVTAAQMLAVHEHNMLFMKLTGQEMRKNAAIAASQAMGADNLEVSIEQETGFQELDENPLEAGFRVQKNAEVENAKSGGKRRGR